jgi:hypothetical protein
MGLFVDTYFRKIEVISSQKGELNQLKGNTTLFYASFPFNFDFITLIKVNFMLVKDFSLKMPYTLKKKKIINNRKLLKNSKFS